MVEALKQDADVSSSEALRQEKFLFARNSPPGLALIEILFQLASRKWLIARVTGVFILIGVVLSFVLPVRYTAVVKIMPPRQTPSAVTALSGQIGMGAMADLGGSSGLFRDPNAVYIGLLESRTIQDSIINKFGLLAEYRAREMSDARKRLQGNTNIASERSSLIEISVADHDKSRAAEIANAYVDNLRVLSRAIAVTEASRRRVFFEDQLKTEKEALIAAEIAFQKVQQSKGLVRLDAQANAIVMRLASLQSQIAVKEVELQTLRSYSTEQNPAVQLAERELSAMKEGAAQLERHNDSSGFLDLSLKDVPEAGLDYIRAQREMLYQQSLFDLLLKQYEVARLDEAKDATVIQVVDPAVEPDRRSAPKRRLIVVLCTFIGFAVGCILALLSRWKDIVLSSPEGANAYQRLKYAFIHNEPLNTVNRSLLDQE